MSHHMVGSYLKSCALLLSSGVNSYKVNTSQINKRASLLQKYLCDEQKELQALFALQALMVHMEQPASESALINRVSVHISICSFIFRKIKPAAV